MSSTAVPPEVSERAAATVTLALLCVLLVAAAVWHLRAQAAYRASFAAGVPTMSRFADAHTAAALEPWDSRSAARRRYVAAWLRAETLLGAGDYKSAVILLSATMGSTPAEPDLLELYRRAQEVQALETNRKAHLQHGHEGPGGTLRPTDIER